MCWASEGASNDMGSDSLAIEPAFPAFSDTYNAGKPQLVWCHLISDLETPVSAWMKLGHDQPNAFLLELSLIHI